MLASLQASDENSEKLGLKHRFFLPEVLPGEPSLAERPLVLLVHGRAGNDKVMWLFSKALEGIKPVVFAPEAPVRDPIGGLSWWLLSHEANVESPLPRSTTLDDLEEPLLLLENFLLKLPEVYGVSLEKSFAFGFSQGAAMVSSLSLLDPVRFKGVGLLSGFVPGVILKQVASLAPTPLPKYFIAHGSEDTIIPLSRAEHARDSLESFGAEVKFHLDSVGHKVGTSGIRALRQWIEEVAV